MRLSLLRNLALLLLAAPVGSYAQMTPELRARIDAAAQKVLADTGVPSASVGVVMDGKIVLTSAYGLARARGIRVMN